MTKNDDHIENPKKLAENNEISDFQHLEGIKDVTPKDQQQSLSNNHLKRTSSYDSSILQYVPNLDTVVYPPRNLSEQSSQDVMHKITLTSPLKKLIRSKSQPFYSRSSETSISQLNKFTKSYIIPAAKWAYSPISNGKSKKVEYIPSYKIEYSVFKPLKNIRPVQNKSEFLLHWQRIIDEDLNESRHPENYLNKDEFSSVVISITDLIELDGFKPNRISQGSSGSYFIYNKRVYEGSQEIYRAGIFKPKDEEPYGPLSPKWTKWLHRTFFPCFFGRSCLIPNLGYVSEAAASILDQQLLSFIVPHTEIIHLKSSSFYYSYWDRHIAYSKLSPKIGSFQCFLKGYMEAQIWFQHFPIPNEISGLPDECEILVGHNKSILDSHFKWNKKTLQQFREELEKLVISDYIMRNTDRGLDNWMIKIQWIEIKRSKSQRKMTPIIKIGAIDSGLAFPWKHPDEWRSFPFGWLFLPLSIIGQPFSMKTRNHYLPLLTSITWWEMTVKKLKEVFMQDADFKERMWKKQLSVLKGQAFNVVEVLKLSHAGPLELTRRETLLIRDDEMNIPELVDSDIMTNAMQTSIYDLNNKPSTHEIPELNIMNDLEPNEMSPLLADNTSIRTTKSEPHFNMSGFEYNLNFNDDHRNNDIGEGGTNTKKVVIERLEKVKNKPPVFTWC
mmetsp:Transcript_6727/g.8370  ORF Transcript_6727/g.8370 Transcript_6727/m.8370 type:complete len:669 (+) Transcript_6727:1915-3921(+)